MISERIDPSRYDIGLGLVGLRRRLYPSAGALVVQTDRVRRTRPVVRGRPIYVIANVVEGPPKCGTTTANDDGQPPLATVIGPLDALDRLRGWRLAPAEGFRPALSQAFLAGSPSVMCTGHSRSWVKDLTGRHWHPA